MGKAAAHLQPEEMVTAVQNVLADEGSEIMQTVADRWIEQGIEQGLQEAILDILSVRFEIVPQEIEAEVTAVNDADQLRYLHRQAILVKNLGEFAALLPESQE